MRFTYCGPTMVFVGIHYQGHSLKALDGETYELDENPNDPRFTPSVVSAPVSSSTVETTTDSGGETPSSPPEELL